MKSFNPDGVFTSNLGSFTYFELSKDEAVVIDVSLLGNKCGNILKNKGYKFLHLIYTHPHNDHVGSYNSFFNGTYGKIKDVRIVTAAALMLCKTTNAINSKKTWDKVVASCKSHNIPLEFMLNGSVFTIGKLKFHIYTSPKIKGIEDCNNYSAIIHIEDEHGVKYLYPGDIESGTQKWCVQNNLPIQSNVVLIPHHQHAYTAESEIQHGYRKDFAKLIFKGMNPKIALSNGLHPFLDQDEGGTIAKAKVKKWYTDAGADFYSIRETKGGITIDTQDGYLTINNKRYSISNEEKKMENNTNVDMPRLYKSRTGTAVFIFQKALCEAGFKVTCDGRFGPNTEAATKKLQKMVGTAQDGVPGPKTYAAFMEYKETK